MFGGESFGEISFAGFPLLILPSPNLRPPLAAIPVVIPLGAVAVVTPMGATAI
jgi:hypothetical protein